AIEKERVVGFRRLLSDRLGCGMGELIGSANDELIEGIARIQLMVGRLEIELGLRCLHRCRRRGLGFGAYELEAQTGTADLSQHSLQEVAIGLREALAEQAGGDANDEAVLFGALLPRGTEPGGVAMRIYSALGVLEYFIPEIHQEICPLR